MMERLHPEPSVIWSFSDAQWLSLPYHGWCWVPSCWSRYPKVRVRAGSVSSKCVLSPLPVMAPLPQRGAVPEKRDQNRYQVGAGTCVGTVLAHQSEFHIAPDLPPSQTPVMATLAPFRCHASSIPTNCALSSAMVVFALVGSGWSKRGWRKCSLQARAHAGAVMGN